MNIILFFWNLIKPKNWLILLSMIINVGICVALAAYVSYLFGLENRYILYISLGVVGLYALLEIIMLTPVGEAVLRSKMKMKPLPETSFVYSVFETVRARTESFNKWLSPRVKLYYTPTNDVNAFALGSRTVCVTSGLTYLPPSQIEGILAHEFGHINYYDSYVSVVARHGNLLFYIAVVLVTQFISLFAFVFDTAISKRFGNAYFFRLAVDFVGNMLITLVSLISGVLFCARSRIVEYKADAFAAKIGEGRNLRDGLITISGGGAPAKKTSLYEKMMGTHPPTNKRIEKLNALIGYGV